MLVIPTDEHKSYSIAEIDSLNRDILNRPSEGDAKDSIKFLIFWSSRDNNDKNGQMWCPDCVEMENSLIKVLEDLPARSTKALSYVYVGQRDEWRSAENPFRKAPWNVERVPTILKIQPGHKISITDQISSPESRLVENEAIDVEKLSKFLSQ
ncbi:hypothetical protein BY996DRAFT_6423794 [Phakopsora pachyrhizi]|uniref:Thioredoxin domain-containing protein n=1 Tax=Phakopsora pachyrhizi TaxID=170000 RepID=A0AAV0BCB4_PHAPC|nr:hypothetical protein BY996DRAFT_6423794 [Phakopsora pachyrhizi]CAH7683483.1 hypothetical protein PPACK8108_LOCUS17026 [Phakopsora pachyrhizi]